MAELSNIAKPYARAVFELAQQQGDLAGWGAQLELLVTIATDTSIARLVNHPCVPVAQLQQLILEVAADKLHSGGINLLKLLIRNRRLAALPHIARAYAARRAEAENIIAAQMITASEINSPQRKQFATALQSKLGHTVQLEFTVDPTLLGGAVLRAGDLVIDGSVRAQLEQLGGALSV